LSKVATGEITADQAMARIETVRRLEALARHAWRGAAHLLGHIETTPQ
jgi:phosphate:Na+ symporter